MTKSAVVTTRVSPEVSEQLDRLAQRLGRSRAWVIQRAVTRYIEEESEFWRFVQDGIDAADRGELIGQEAMEAWFETRGRRAAAE